VYIPRGFNLREILKFVLSILGLTWANIRAKLVRATNEATVVALETGFDIVRTLVTEGPAAAWEKILEAVGNLRQMAIDAIMDFVKSRVVQAAVTRLLSMLSPAGAFIQAVIAIYNTIMFFVERLRQIAQVAASFIDAIATIAAGNIGPAANRVETTMAGLLTLVISFLARIAGLGRVADAVTGLIARIRAPIDRGLDRVVAWIVAQARRLGRFVAQAGVPQDPQERLRLAARASMAIARTLPNRGLTGAIIERAHNAIKVRYALRELSSYQNNGQWFVRAVINPPLVWRLPVAGETAGTGGIRAVATSTGPGGVVTAGVRGELQPGMNRATAPNYNTTMPGVGTLPTAVAHFVTGYRWAHLYGPGFGDEARTGLMLASQNVNNELQSRGRVYGIEGYARQIRELATRLGGRAAVEVVASSFPDPPSGVPQAIGHPLLRTVTYSFVIANAAGDEVRYQGRRATASITCGVPLPNGTGGQGTAHTAHLIELQNYLGSRSTRSGL
jgi:Bacterial toxin 4